MFFNIKKKYKIKARFKLSSESGAGFTIIELVITIFILSFAIVGIFSAFSIMATLTYDATDRLTAAYLGQEGVEITRNIRDVNWLEIDALGSGSWVDGLTNCETSSCQADFKSSQLQNLSNPYLNIDPKGFYSYDSAGTASKFKRKITITPLMDFDGSEATNHIIKVTVQVSWDKKGTILGTGYLASECVPANCITIIETLYDWYNYTLTETEPVTP